MSELGPAHVHTARVHPVDAVSGKPRIWLRLEGLVVLVGSIALFATTQQPWWLVPVLILLPDICAAGYVSGSRVGALAYNIGHTYLLPAAVSGVGLATDRPLCLAIGLLWFAHIGMDRFAGYGLKYDTDFKDTHLGRL